MDVFDLQARLTLDSSAYDQGLEEARDSASNFGSYLGTAMKVASGTIAAVTGAVTAVSAAFVGASGSVAAYGDSIDKMSQKMGISAKAYQEWDAVLQHSGTSISVLRSSMRQLVNAAQGGSEAFQALGISQQEAAAMSQEDLFSATIEALQSVEDQTKRTYIANQLLGRGAMELGALLNTSAEDTQRMKERVHELNGVMSDEAVKAAAAYQDSLQDMSTAFEGLKRNMMSEFLPSVTTVMDGLADLFSGNTESGLGLVGEGVSKFTDSLASTLPEVLRVGEQILTSLTESITGNLPVFIETTIPPLLGAFETVIETLVQSLPSLLDSIVTVIPPVIKDIATTLIKEIPTVGKAVVESVSKIISEVGDMLPEVIPLAVQAVGDLVETITSPESLEMILDAGLTLVTGLAQGIGEALPKLADSVTDIINNVVKFLTDPENTVKIIGSAFDIIGSLAGGILQAIPELAFGVGEIIFNIGDTLMNADWGKVGSDIMQAIGDGISNGGEFVVNAVDSGLGAIDSLLGTHLQDWYREVTDFWRDAGAKLSDILHADEINATERSIKVAELRRDIVYASNEFIRQGDSAAESLEKAKEKFLLTPEDLSLWNEFLANDLTVAEAEDRAATIDAVTSQYEKSLHLPTEALRQMNGEQAQVLSELPPMYENAFDTAADTVNEKLEESGGFVSKAIGEYTNLGVQKTLGQVLSDADKEADSIAKEVYTASQNYANRQTKFLNLSYGEQIALWTKIKNQFVEGSEQYQQAEEKIFDLKKQAEDKSLADTKAYNTQLEQERTNAYNTAIEDIRRNSKIYEWSYEQTIQAYTDLQAQYEEGSKEYNQIAEKIYDTQQKQTKAAEDEAKKREQIAKKETEAQKKELEQRQKALDDYKKKIEDINSEIAKIEQTYTDTLTKRTDEIFNSFNLFDKVPERVAVSGKDLIENLRGQYDTMQKFYSDLDKLTERGVSEGLVEQIRGMGVGALDQLDALLDLDAEQLEKYNKLYDDKQALAEQQAESELTGLKAETEQKIADEMSKIDALQKEAGEKLGLTFAESIAEGIITGTDDIMQSLGVVFNAATDLFNKSGTDSPYKSANTVRVMTDVSTAASTVNRNSAGSTATENVVVNINGIQYQNFTELVKAVAEELQFQTNRGVKGYVGAV